MKTEETEEWMDADLFQEPADFRPPSPQPTVHLLKRNKGETPEELRVTLIGHHSLWSHCLWNAGVCLAKFLDQHPVICQEKRVLELGAAAALPSLICAIRGAKKVVITDYPDAPIIDRIKHNIQDNIPHLYQQGILDAQGYLWGQDVQPLLDASNSKFDLIIMSDLIFNHTEHLHLLETALNCLAPSCEKESDIYSKEPQILVCFSHHRPWLKDRDMKFFDIAKNPPFNLHVEHVSDTKMDAMFPEDPGDVSIRETVHLYRMTRNRQ